MADVGPAEGLEAQLRQVDPDRWLTSRFVADRVARADLAALYLFDHELARARRAASTPLIAEIRLAWWREALDEMFGAGPVRRHPTAEALAAVVRNRALPRALLEAMVDGHAAALDAGRPDEAGALAFAAAAEASAAQLAAIILDAVAPSEAAAPAGRAFGLALTLRAGMAERATIAGPLRAALVEAAVAARRLSPAAFPAALPARLARFDLARRPVGELRRRIALVLAAATGRI